VSDEQQNVSACVASESSAQLLGALEDAWRINGALDLRGWMLLDGRPCERIELWRDGALAALAMRVERADLAQAFPEYEHAERGGFSLTSAASGRRDAPVTLRAVSHTGAVVERTLVERDGGPGASRPCDLGPQEIEFKPRTPSAAGACDSEPGALYGVSIDTTSVCNLRCTICALERDYDIKAHMPLALFARLEDAFAQLRHISFSLNAEPLLNRELEAMVALAKQRSDGRITTSLATNAMLLDATRLHALNEAGLDALEISIDGVKRDSYLAVRLGANFERLVENIARAAALERGGGRAPHVSLRWVMSTSNVGELPDLLEFAARVGVRHLVVNGLEPYTAEQSELTHFTRLEESELRAQFEALEDRATQLGLRLDLPLLRPEPYTTCELIEHACVIRVDGTVAPCSPLSYSRAFYFEGREERHPLIGFGSIAERPLLELWNAPDYVEFRRKALHGPLHDACKSCLKRSGVICPLKHWNWLAAGAPQPRR
jgi:MoaA/NifB/PqqE/SkfB family radical SAM enzyme